MRTPLVFAALALALGACTAPQRAVTKAPPLTDDQLRHLPIYDGATGQRLTWDQAAQRIGNADAAIFGEEHSHPVGLPGAAVLFEDAIERYASHAIVSNDEQWRESQGALALEFWERDQQPDIDAYLASEIDRDTFKEGHGSNYPPGHERMLEAAKAFGMKVVAANAPRRFVRLARTEGYDHLRETLSPEDRALLVIPDELDDGPYRDRFFDLMGGMSGHTEDTESDEPDPMVLSFFRSQQIWDATMADSVATLVRTGHRPAILVVGRFHSDHQGSTLVRTRELLGSADVVSVTFAGRELGLLGLHPEDRGMADIVIYTGEQTQ